MRSAALCCVVLLALTTVFRAQSSSPTFEVASIKPNNSAAAEGGIRVQPGGRFAWTNMTLKQLIATAYGFDQREVIGGPGWLGQEHFDVIAKVEAGTSPLDANGSPGPLFAMLRRLLEDRFQLGTHRESADRPIYTLVLARAGERAGRRLVPSNTDCDAVMRDRAQGNPPEPAANGVAACAIRPAPGRIDASAISTQQLAGVLARILGRPVIDRTGLTGNFDVTLEFQPDFQAAFTTDPARLEPAADPNAPSIFTAVQEQLGLKLESARGSVDVLIVDRADKPTEN